MKHLIGEPTPTLTFRVVVTTEERFEFILEAEDAERAEDIARDRAQPGYGDRTSIHAVAHLHSVSTLEEQDD